MNSIFEHPFTTLLLRHTRNFLFPVVLLASIFIIVVPLPPMIMDILLSVNITLAVLILITTIFVKTPLEFSTFPTLLLSATLFRLGLNVATTRMILSGAETEGTLAAGHVIQTFSTFVSSGNLAVGAVIFLIIVIIQFVVITKGATRISEVSARFVLDGLPGKQMTIDADLHSGALTQQEAQEKRRLLADEVDFYGAMDGASKFVRGDAVAGLCITAVNIIAGLSIGLYAGNYSLPEVVRIYTQLTIGDGLVSQLPAFLIAVATALLVTRGSRETDLPNMFTQQIFSRPAALIITTFFLLCLLMTPLPKIPLIILGAGCVATAWVLETEARKKQQLEQKAERIRQKEEKKNVSVEKLLHVDPIEIELGHALLPLLDAQNHSEETFGHARTFEERTFLEEIHEIRLRLAKTLGFLLPHVRIRDSEELDTHEYRIRIHGSPVTQNVLHHGMFLALERQNIILGAVPGMKTRDFSGNTPASWIEPEYAAQALEYGYTVLTHRQILLEHLEDVVRKFAPELLSRDAVQHLLTELQKTAPVVVQELIPEKMSVLEVQKVLCLLLKEQVSIRHLALILETLSENITQTTDAFMLTEAVRIRLGRAITSEHLDLDGHLYTLALSPEIEAIFHENISVTAEKIIFHMSPSTSETILQTISLETQKLQFMNRKIVLMTSSALRKAIREFIFPRITVPVLSTKEIPLETPVELLHVIRLPESITTR
ncbi:MAG: flagellar biosynthesis protein FlhA [Planctomycetia bacterium]|nr:flagellar biosynthesis protein FlhA [Planctomycetia bacterium]